MYADRPSSLRTIFRTQCFYIIEFKFNTSITVTLPDIRCTAERYLLADIFFLNWYVFIIIFMRRLLYYIKYYFIFFNAINNVLKINTLLIRNKNSWPLPIVTKTRNLI